MFSVNLTAGAAGSFAETESCDAAFPTSSAQQAAPPRFSPANRFPQQRYTALLTNRSPDALVFFVRQGLLMNANWDWSITDAGGLPVGMELVLRGYCGTVPGDDPNAHFLHDDDVRVLGPGESHAFSIPAGPSDDYSFPSAGTYHLAVTLTYVPPNAAYYFDERGKRQPARSNEQWNLRQLGALQHAAMENSLSVQATSDTWNLELPAKRRARP